MLKVFSKGPTLCYEPRNEETADLLTSLSDNEILVFDAVERAQDSGVWMRDLKIQTSLPNMAISKILQTLKRGGLVKEVTSFTSKSRKIYMLAHITPSRSITGGPWYSNNAFDEEFVRSVEEAVLGVVGEEGEVNLDRLEEEVRGEGLGRGDVHQLTMALVYDETLQLVPDSSPSNPSFVLSQDDLISSSFSSQVPCVQCPISDTCGQDSSTISPCSCPHLSSWLDNHQPTPSQKHKFTDW